MLDRPMDVLEFQRDIGNAATAFWAYRDFLIKANLFGPKVVALEDALLQLGQSLSALGAALAEEPMTKT